MESTLVEASELPDVQRQLTYDELAYFRVRGFHPNGEHDSVRRSLRDSFVTSFDWFVQRRGTKGWQATTYSGKGELRWWGKHHATPLAAYVEAELREWKD